MKSLSTILPYALTVSASIISGQTGRLADRQMDVWMDRQIQTERQTGRQTYGQTDIYVD